MARYESYFFCECTLANPKLQVLEEAYFFVFGCVDSLPLYTNRNGSRGAVRQAGAELGSASCSAGIVLLLLLQTSDALKPQHRNSFWFVFSLSPCSSARSVTFPFLRTEVNTCLAVIVTAKAF